MQCILILQLPYFLDRYANSIFWKLLESLIWILQLENINIIHELNETSWFLQARAIHELTKKVFYVLETYPEKFELEFSETRQRSGRRARGEAGRSASSSYPKIAANMKSHSMKIAEFSKAIPCSLSGSSNVRRCQVKTGCSGTFDAREHRVLSGKK